MRTINRQPFTVSTPSKSDAQDYFFNHYNWKGASDDENFLTSDQETFESCDNVYMDENGLLRSRPSVKPSKYTTSDIKKTWTFGDTLVCCVSEGAGYKLLFLNVAGQLLNSIPGFNTLNINPILKDGKIFIFSDTPGKFQYFDLLTNNVLSAVDYVYIPKVEIGGNGENNGESPNLLSLAQLTIYLYSSSLSVPPQLNGTRVSVVIDDIEYEFVFDTNTSPLRLFSKLGTTSVTAKVFTATFSDVTLLVLYDYSTGELKTSTDGELWTSLRTNPYRTTTKLYGLSKDGLLFYIVTTNNKLYFLSTLPDENGYEYPEFTSVHEGIINPNNSISNIDLISVNSFSEFVVIGEIGSYVKGILFVNEGTVSHVFHVPYQSAMAVDASYNPLSKGKFDVFFVYGKDGKGYTGSYFDGEYAEVFTISEDSLSNTRAYPFAYNRFVVFEYYRIDAKVMYGLFEFDDKGYPEIIDSSIGANALELDSNVTTFNDGKYVALPTGIYVVSTGKMVRYLNVVSNQVVIPMWGTDYLYYRVQNSDVLYTNYVPSPIELKVENDGEILSESFVGLLSTAHWSELSTFYAGNDKNLYISSQRTDVNGNFLWYFPTINRQSFNYNITGLYPISNTEMGIFFDNEIWYSSYSEGVYYYNKSKLQVGLKQGSTITASYDGTAIIFPTKRGLVSLSYQDFVASTDQALTILSDPIHEQFVEYCKNPVRICRHQYWYICYNQSKVYYLDVRTGGWWPMTFGRPFNDIVQFNDDLLLLIDNKLYNFDYKDDNYYDIIGTNSHINWHVKSQKLHLNAVNYYKHIANITLLSVLDSDKDMSFTLNVTNYRKGINNVQAQNITYKVDAIRTFVKRVSYPKVNEFQYKLYQDDEQAIRLPLSLSGITIKYRVGGQVR